MKKLPGMLPTMNVTTLRHGILYMDRKCHICKQAKEDNEYIWHC